MFAENKALARRFYEEIDRDNLAAMYELVAEDYLGHSPPPKTMSAHGPSRQKAYVAFGDTTDATRMR